MTSTQQQKITNEITALFMGRLDSRTGKWFPIKKMVWEEKNSSNYLNCSIHFLQGAQIYQSLYPERKNLFSPSDLNRTMQYKDILSCAWRNRMPVSRPLEKELKVCMGFDSDTSIDPVKYVARSGGYRHGDLCSVFPEISTDTMEDYNFIFRGIDAWVMCADNKPELEKLAPGTQVTLHPPEKTEIMPGEWENPNYSPPPEATRMKMYVDSLFVGYAPPYVKELYAQFKEHLKISIYQSNCGVPFEYQFLFLASVNRQLGIPFADPKFHLINIDEKEI